MPATAPETYAKITSTPIRTYSTYSVGVPPMGETEIIPGIVHFFFYQRFLQNFSWHLQLFLQGWLQEFIILIFSRYFTNSFRNSIEDVSNDLCQDYLGDHLKNFPKKCRIVSNWNPIRDSSRVSLWNWSKIFARCSARTSSTVFYGHTFRAVFKNYFWYSSSKFSRKSCRGFSKKLLEAYLQGFLLGL